ncbi:universal stress protein [Actinoplanes sp. CA-051413]|uniref:universal stress protein n=1 Tax=Actinoplanes sp. CA-051413 TaxID=3239899 RepID=UPI003D98D312
MPEHGIDSTGRIVVGVDGSPGSKTALMWAMNQARLTGATIQAVTAWEDPARYGTAYGWTATAFDGNTFATAIAKDLDATVADVTAQMEYPVTVLTQIVEGHPAETLLRAADGAQLLVVGSRGHGTFAGIILGSVSQHCVQHAPCPVVVVP